MELFSIEKEPEFIQLQIEMIAMQKWVQETGQRLAILLFSSVNFQKCVFVAWSLMCN